jgi:hypothetical protein
VTDNSEIKITYNAKSILFVYVIASLRISDASTVNYIVREMTYAKKNQRLRSYLDKVIRGV